MPINPQFDPYIGTRPSAVDPNTTEYFRKDNNAGFSAPNQLFSYASGLGQGNVQNFDALNNPQTPNQQVATQAAQAGIGLGDFSKLYGDQTQITQDELNKIKSSLGIDQLEQQVFTPPSQSTTQLYQTAYNTAGLTDLKAKIDAKLKEINDINAKYTEAAGRINENPWLSESSLTGRLRTLDEKRQAEIANLNNEAQQLSNLYNNGIGEVHNLVTMQSQDFANNQQLNQQKLEYLLKQAEQQSQTLQDQKSSSVYKYLPDYLQAKAKAQAPDTIKLPDGSLVQYDQNTGTFVQLSGPEDKLLSVAEAAKLGVPYGTTQSQAAALNTTPSIGKTSPATKTAAKSPGTSSSKVTSTQLADAFKTGWAKEGYIQGNGKISSKDYKEAKTAWRKEGFTGAAFDNAMSDLIDKSSPNWKTDYGYGS